MDRVDCIVVGAGVVGLAIARALAMSGREVIIVEAETMIGSGTSSRNSEVIHAGIYYPAGSLKARLCVEGRRLLYRYCADNAIPHRRCGKLIVATGNEQDAALDGIIGRARINGVDDVRRLSREQAQEMEPQLACTAALLSPSTGIIDSHALMLQLLADAEAAGASLALQSKVVAGRIDNAGVVLDILAAHDEPMSLHASLVVNAAGLFAPGLAAALAGMPAAALPEAVYSKGNYYSLSAKAPFSRLIYPLPGDAGLGVHLTLDLAGQARFGPDVEWLKISDPAQISFDVDPRRADGFYAAIRRYWPELPDDSLQPSYAGVRPKVSRSGDADFVIQDRSVHGIPGLINLFGIESPGLTASLAIGAQVAALAAQARSVL